MRLVYATALLEAFATATSLESQVQPYHARPDTLLVYVEEDEPRYNYRGPEYHEYGPYTVGPNKRAYSDSDSGHYFSDNFTSDISHHFHGYHDESYYDTDSSEYFQPYSALDELEAIVYRATRPVFNQHSYSSHSEDYYYSDNHQSDHHPHQGQYRPASEGYNQNQYTHTSGHDQGYHQTTYEQDSLLSYIKYLEQLIDQLTEKKKTVFASGNNYSVPSSGHQQTYTTQSQKHSHHGQNQAYSYETHKQPHSTGKPTYSQQPLDYSYHH